MKQVIINIEHPLAKIIINNPPANSLSNVVLEEFEECLKLIHTEKNVKSVILSGGEGKVFASGTDIRELLQMGKEEANAIMGRLKKLFDRIKQSRLPFFCAINGRALGAGLGLALNCDFRVASKSAKFGFPEINLGIIPAAGATQHLLHLVGIVRARWLIMSGEIISADQALSIGLVDQLSDPETLLKKTEEMALQIAAKAPLAIEAIKKALYASWEMPISQALKEETRLFAQLGESEDHAEALRAFLEKSSPNFKGQ